MVYYAVQLFYYISEDSYKTLSVFVKKKKVYDA